MLGESLALGIQIFTAFIEQETHKTPNDQSSAAAEARRTGCGKAAGGEGGGSSRCDAPEQFAAAHCSALRLGSKRLESGGERNHSDWSETRHSWVQRQV